MAGFPEDPELAAEWFDFLSARARDLDAGRSFDADAYAARFPALVDEIAQRWVTLDCDQAEPRDDFGPYHIHHELGHGGQGSVYLATDTRLDRRVALKLLSPLVGHGSTERLRRFRREARILSQLDHPGICKVFEADIHEGVPFLAMQLVGGETLARILQSRRERDALPRDRDALDRVLAWIEATARALHVAHTAGVVHRDVKPGNLRIDERDQPIVLDFGLAWAIGAEQLDLTRSDSQPGTLAYMAPELLGNDGRPTPDPRADVYALGVTLYECLTLRLPYRDTDRTGLAHAIRVGDLIDVRRAHAAVSRDVAAIVHTALARDPAARYRSAEDLADDLARARSGQAVQARLAPWSERALRGIRRHPTLAVSAASLLLLVAVLSVSVAVLSTRERVASALHRSRTAALGESEAMSALSDLVDAMDRSPAASLRSAMLEVLTHCNRAWERVRDRPPAMTVAIDPAVSADGGWVAIAHEGGRVELLDAPSGAVRANAKLVDSRVLALAFRGADELWVGAEDGTLLATATDDLRVLRRLREPGDGPVRGLSVTPDGTAMAVGGDDGLSLLSLPTDGTQEQSRQIALPDAGAVRTFRFAPGGGRLLALSHSTSPDPDAADVVHVVDLLDDSPPRRADGLDQPILSAAWHPDGTHFALAGNAGRVVVRAIDRDQPVFRWDADQEVHWVGFDPEGDLLLVPVDRGTALWEWRAAQPVVRQRIPNASLRTWGAAAFSSDGRRLAAVHRDGTVSIIDARAWRIERSLKQNLLAVRHLAWIPNTDLVLTSDLDRVTAWHSVLRPHAPEFDGHPDAVQALAQRPGHDEWASAGADRTVRVWSPHEAAPRLVLHCTTGAPDGLNYSKDGHRLFAWSSGDGAVLVWDAHDGRRLASFDARSGTLAAVEIGPEVEADAGTLATAGTDGRIRIWSLDHPEPVRSFGDGSAPVFTLARAPDGHLLAAGSADREVRLWDPRSGALVASRYLSEELADWRTIPIHQVRALSWGASGTTLHASLVNNKLVHWSAAANGFDARSPAREIVVDRFGGPMAVVPETAAPGAADRLVCADYSFGRLSLVEGATLVPLEVGGQSAHGNRITAVCVTPDGRLAASAGCDGLLRIWDLEHAALHAEVRTGAAILAAAFDESGRWIVTGTVDGRIARWPVAPLELARALLLR